MKQELLQLVSRAAAELGAQGVLDSDALPEPHLERTRDPSHGDFATNIAMVAARSARCNPRDLAQQFIAALPTSDLVTRAEVAGPGFINFFIDREAWFDVIDAIRSAGENYGHSDIGAGSKVMVEFVSANPTGPLHVGHGRGAAYGDSVARVLRATGHDVHTEYYVNDAGRQMDILALSVWLRYLDLCGESVALPGNAYQGDYIWDIAATLHREHGDAMRADAAALFDDLPDDPELCIDQLVHRCKETLGTNRFKTVFDCGCDSLVENIRLDLRQFGVEFDRWFSERSLLDGGDIDRAIAALDANGHIYTRDGARWFRATDFGDEKDWVVQRANGTHTYFASDIAYHFNKGERGFDLVLDVFGADHHGYVNRIRASYEALGHDREGLRVLLVQFANLFRGGEKVSMSTRGGDFVTLRELREEVGNDAARFFYVSRKSDQHMDFDLDLAKSQSSDNPVYYVQYAHARICSVFRQLEEKGLPTLVDAQPDYGRLEESREMELIQTLSKFPELVEAAARGQEPHQVAYYLRDLATDFHAYYNAHPFLSSEPDVRLARLGLVDATRQVIANGLALLGVSAPEKM